MSGENVERLRRAYEAFSRGDFDTALEIVHPEFEFVRAGGQSRVTGAEEAFRAWMEPDALEDARVEPLEFRTKGSKILVRGSLPGASGGRSPRSRRAAELTQNQQPDALSLALLVEGFDERRALGPPKVPGPPDNRQTVLLRARVHVARDLNPAAVLPNESCLALPPNRG